jgi:hypothetical protein
MCDFKSVFIRFLTSDIENFPHAKLFSTGIKIDLTKIIL